MKMKNWLMLMTLLTPVLPGIGKAQETTPTPVVTAVSLEQEKLDVERLRLENEKLKLEIEKMQLSATAVATPAGTPTVAPSPTPNKDALADFKQSFSDKAMALSKAHAAEADLMVLDFVNSEIWFKGVRYSVYELPALAEDQKLKVSKTLDERLPNGSPRWRYQVANLTLLKYEARDKGILEITAPQAPGDFRLLTVEGLSFDSTEGDVRDSAQNPYLKYDGQGESQGFKTLRYGHDAGLAFGDGLQFLVTRDGKIHKIRFGTLDER
ncbi:MAG TPA: hypothetical protein VMU88_00840 [bacterium]|nr:hypothetical protein [bacterium]